MNAFGNIGRRGLSAVLLLVLLGCTLHSNRVYAQSDTAWQLVNFGSNTNVYGIDFLNADTGWIAGGAGLFMTTDSGSTWLPWGPAGSYRKVEFLNSQIGWAEESISSTGIIHTTNGGQSWTNESLSYAPYDVHFINADTGVACGDGEVSRTTDGGAHWGDSAVEGGVLHKILAFDQTHLLIVGGPAVWENQWQQPLETSFYYSSDAGWTWKREKFNLTNTLLTGTVVNPEVAFVAGDTNRNIGITVDGGQSWNFIREPYGWFWGSCFASNNVWYVSGARTSGASAILVSTDAGNSWMAQKCPDIGTLVDIKFSTPLNGWAGCDAGGFLRTTNGGFASVAATQPAKQNLPIQIFPNPSQGQVQFQYDLPKAESVTLRIYNTTGQLISTPLSEARQTPGAQIVRLTTGALAAGDYVFLLQSEDYIQSGRFAVVK